MSYGKYRCKKCGNRATPLNDIEDGQVYTVMYWCDECEVEVE